MLFYLIKQKIGEEYGGHKIQLATYLLVTLES